MNFYFRSFALLLSLVFFFSSLSQTKLELLYISIIFLFIHNLIFSFKDIYIKIIYLLFHLTFLTFILSRILISFLNGEIYEPFESLETNYHIGFSVYISLLGIFMGFTFFSLIQKKFFTPKKKLDPFNNKKSRFFQEKNYVGKVRKVSFILLFFAFIALTFKELETLYIMKGTSYNELRLAYSSSLPSMVLRLANMYFIFLCIYLATMPDKKGVIFSFFSLITIGVIVMMYGVRGDLVLNILFIIAYLVIRNRVDYSNKSWFGKKEVLIIIVLTPFLISILNVVGISRYEDKLSIANSEQSTLENFFYSQGISIDIIGYVKEYENEFPEKKYYSVDRTLTFVKNNFISKTLFNTEEYKAHTIERALYGNSLGQTLSYLVYPESYLNGVGMGSSYIAEVYKDFGYKGLLLVNIFYGMLMVFIVPKKTTNVWLLAPSFLMIQGLLYAPRSSSDGFISNVLSIPNVAAFVLVWITAKFVKGKRVKGE